MTSLPRARFLVALVAVAAYANSLGNGFAYDDNWFIALNPVVTEARWGEALSRAAWPGAVEGTGNYRPLTLSSFALEWSIWGPGTFGFHAVSVVAHAAVSLLVLALLGCFVTVPAALLGALFFAVHPVHTEAVANVMGRAELYAAIGYLSACIVYTRWRPLGGAGRGARLLVLVLLFLVALASKEIAVSLPGMLVVLEAYRRTERPLEERWRREAPTYLALAATLACYVLVRWSALGDLTGESPAAGLRSLDRTERILTALTVWPHYLRLMVFPLDLVSDYGPPVLPTTTSLTPLVAIGALYLIGALACAWLLRREAPAAALGFAWFVVAVSPVSNLIVRADILLAERTLYLPSVGAALVVAAVAARALALPSVRARRLAGAAAIVAGGLLMARTVDRNPAWMDTFSALQTLAEEHPESWLSHRTHAIGLIRVGDREAAAQAYEAALAIAPDHYQILVDAAVLYFDMGRHDRAEELLHQAIALLPGHPEAWRRLSEQRLLRGDGRSAHRIALEGMVRARDDALLWGLLSESYVAKGDLEGALRARRAAVARDDDSAAQWRRLAELYEAMDRPREAAEARRRAGVLTTSDSEEGA